MPPFIDYYAVLGVSPNATQDEIKKAFRRLSWQYHPDPGATILATPKFYADQYWRKNRVDIPTDELEEYRKKYEAWQVRHRNEEDKFKELNNAYDILSDPQRRAEYNLTWNMQSRMSSRRPASPQPQTPPSEQQKADTTAEQEASAASQEAPEPERAGTPPSGSTSMPPVGGPIPTPPGGGPASPRPTPPTPPGPRAYGPYGPTPPGGGGGAPASATPPTAGVKWSRALEEEIRRLELLKTMPRYSPTARYRKIGGPELQREINDMWNRRVSVAEDTVEDWKNRELAGDTSIPKPKVLTTERVPLGSAPSASMRVVTRDRHIEEIIRSSRFFDKTTGTIDRSLMKRAEGDMDIYREKAAAIELMKDDITRTITADRISERVAAANALGLGASGHSLPSYINRDIANIVTYVALDQVMQNWRQIRADEGISLEQASRTSQTETARAMRSARVEREARGQIERYLRERTTITASAELQELSDALWSASREAISSTVIPDINVHVQDHGVGLRVSIQEVNVDERGQASADHYTLLMHDNPATVSNPAASAYVENLYQGMINADIKRDLMARERWGSLMNEKRQWLTPSEVQTLRKTSKSFRAFYLDRKIAGTYKFNKYNAFADNLGIAYNDQLDQWKEAPLFIPYQLAYQAVVPLPIRNAVTNTARFIQGKPLANQLFPYLESGQYMNTMTLNWMSQMTGWVDVDYKGRPFFAPLRLPTLAARGLLNDVMSTDWGRNYTDGGSNFLRNLMFHHDGTWTGITKLQAQRALNLNFGAKLRANRGKIVRRFVNGETTVIGAALAFLIGSAISAGTTWVLEKLGVMKYVRELGQMTTHITNAWKYGAGISSSAYARAANIELVSGNVLRGRIMKGLSFAGKNIIPILRTPLEGLRVVTPALFRAAGIYALSFIIGMNPVSAGILAGSYFGLKTFDALMRSEYFFGKYFVKGGLPGMRSVYHAVENTRWLRLAEKVLGHKLPMFWAQFSRAYNTQWYKLGALKVPGATKMMAWVSRNIPIDGILWSTWLAQLFPALGIWAYTPVALDLAFKVAQSFAPLLRTRWWGRLILRPFAVPQFFVDTLLGIYTMHLSDGFFGAWGKLFTQPFKLSNLFSALGTMSPALGAFGLISVITGSLSWPVWVAALAFQGVVVVADYLARYFAGQSLWQLIAPRLSTMFGGLFGNIGNAIAGFGSLFTGLIGFVQSLLRGDAMGIAISGVLFAAGFAGLATSANSSISTMISARYTPTGGGGGYVYPEEGNDYVKEFKKTYTGIKPEKDLYFDYVFTVKQDVQITEVDEFFTEPHKDFLVTSVEFGSGEPANTTKDLATKRITIGPNDYTSGKQLRSYKITLSNSLQDLLEDGELFCNKATLKMAGEDLSLKVCIDKDGQVSGLLDTPPVTPGDSHLSITSCFAPRQLGGTGTPHFHAGLDIGSGATNPPIYAAGSGVITKKNASTGDEGNYIKIDHGNGVQTLYLHLYQFADNMYEGRSVASGQVIGFVGSTGNSSGNHLHFAVIKDGKDYNPCLVETLNLCDGHKYPFNYTYLSVDQGITSPHGEEKCKEYTYSQ